MTNHLLCSSNSKILHNYFFFSTGRFAPTGIQFYYMFVKFIYHIKKRITLIREVRATKTMDTFFVDILIGSWKHIVLPLPFGNDTIMSESPLKHNNVLNYIHIIYTHTIIYLSYVMVNVKLHPSDKPIIILVPE